MYMFFFLCFAMTATYKLRKLDNEIIQQLLEPLGQSIATCLITQWAALLEGNKPCKAMVRKCKQLVAQPRNQN